MCLEKEHGGKGVLLGGVPGVRRGRVAVIGGGVVGTNAAKMAVGMGADVTILDVNQNQLAYLDDVFLGRVEVLSSDSETIARAVRAMLRVRAAQRERGRDDEHRDDRRLESGEPISHH